MLKRIGIIGTAAMAICASVLLLRYKRPMVADCDTEDGGVCQRYDSNAPKKINSTKIKTFKCEVSLFTLAEEDTKLSGKVFMMSAERAEDGDVLVLCEAYDRYSERFKLKYTAGREFMEKLSKIVAERDLASYNGNYYSVSGLPDNYGYSLSVLYESGEQFSASDNSSMTLPIEAVEELVEFFFWKMPQK